MHARDQDKVVYSVSPTNRQPDGEDKSGVRTVSLNVHRSPTRTIVRMAGYG